jgi:hypothetical protein
MGYLSVIPRKINTYTKLCDSCEEPIGTLLHFYLELQTTVRLSNRSGIVKANTKFASLFHLNFPRLPLFLPVKVCVRVRAWFRFFFYPCRPFIAPLGLSTCKKIPLL